MTRTITLGIFVLVLILFFLFPWMQLSVVGVAFLPHKGIQLLTGLEYTYEGFTERITEPEPMAVLPLGLALVGVALYFAKGRKGDIGRGVAGILGVVSVAGLAAKMSKEVSAEGFGIAGVDWEVGFWLTILAFLSVSGLSFYNLRSPRREVEMEAPTDRVVRPRLREFSGARCHRCGRTNPQGAHFCSSCGVELRAAARPVETANVVCQNCGTENAPQNRFCAACGARLSKDDA